MKRPKITLKENEYTFTIDEEEEIKRQYELAKEKVSRRVQLKMIRSKHWEVEDHQDKLMRKQKK